MKTNVILQGDALTKLKELPEKSINCLMTSPPYWALRDYGTDVETIWDGEEDCEHYFEEVTTPQSNMSGGKGHLQDGNKGSFAVDYNKRETKSGFCNKCGAWKGQLGLEPTFDLYIKHLCDIFEEAKRVLRDDGTCWINLGDTYYGSGAGTQKNLPEESNSKEVYTMPYVAYKHIQRGEWKRPSREEYSKGTIKKNCLICKKEFKGKENSQFCSRECLNKKGNDFRSQNRLLKDKCLTMIPMRFAIEMINRGWILRNTIIWHKPNCMPSSVKDRFTVDFEYIFFFVKNKKYWFETQYEELKSPKAKGMKFGGNKGCPDNPTYSGNVYDASKLKGRNKRAVWQICPQPFKEAHFAVYPEELCETPIKAGCPEFVCVECGNPKVKILEHNKISEEGEDFLETNKTPYSIQERKGFVKVRKLPDIKYFAIALTKERVMLKLTIDEIERKLDSQAPHHWFSAESFPSVGDWNRLKKMGFVLPEFDKLLTKEYFKPAEKQRLDYSEKGYKPTCNCNAEFTGGIVLDPFFGAGTTGLVALKQNKKFIGIELNPEYIEIAKKRLKPYLEQKGLAQFQPNVSEEGE